MSVPRTPGHGRTSRLDGPGIETSRPWCIWWRATGGAASEPLAIEYVYICGEQGQPRRLSERTIAYIGARGGRVWGQLSERASSSASERIRSSSKIWPAALGAGPKAETHVEQGRLAWVLPSVPAAPQMQRAEAKGLAVAVFLGVPRIRPATLAVTDLARWGIPTERPGPLRWEDGAGRRPHGNVVSPAVELAATTSATDTLRASVIPGALHHA